MSTYDAVHVSNAILKQFFDAGQDITPKKLYTVMYLASAEYMKLTGKKLIQQRFEASLKGPVVSSVKFKFDCYKKKPIRKYAKDAAGKAYLANDKNLRKVLKKLFPVVSSLSTEDLAGIHHCTNSAWRNSYNQQKSFIDDNDVRDDRTYREFLGMRYFMK